MILSISCLCDMTHMRATSYILTSVVFGLYNFTAFFFIQKTQIKAPSTVLVRTATSVVTPRFVLSKKQMLYASGN